MSATSGILAPGGPGHPPRWTSSAKEGVGASISLHSRVWFTHSHGIVNEIYYPRVDRACVRDLGLIVTDGREFLSEEKRDATARVEYLADGVPAYRITNTCKQGRYVIEKEMLADPARDVFLQHTRFRAIEGVKSDYRLYMLLAPHLGNKGWGNTAWVGEYKGVPMMFAIRDGVALAVACSAPWLGSSVGYVGFSDGWQDLSRHKRLTWHYQRAEAGNVAIVGEIDLAADDVVLAVGFGHTIHEAAHRAAASILDGFGAAKDQYLREWEAWHGTLMPLDDGRSHEQNVYRVSAAVIRTHAAKDFPGGIVASLSIPWGMSKGDDNLGGYHLVWPRDLVETTTGLMAAGAADLARTVLRYLQVTQEADGHWAQNMWLDGTPYWDGIQMDEAALPIMLVDLAYRERMLDDRDLVDFWPMVRHSAGYLVKNGPVTQQDRWEEDAGYSPFTLAAEIAALLIAAEMADRQGEHREAQFLRETSDLWHSNLDRWIYAADTELARRLGVRGYYVRIAPESDDGDSPLKGVVVVKNRPLDRSLEAAADLVSPDALALVRFGLRAADDPRMVDTVKVIDALLKVELPPGPCWYRYNEDGYGERENGEPFDGTGIGRAWPLLTGERAHFEVAAGRVDEAKRLLKTFEQFANCGGLLPEQVWDAEDIPEKELFRGKPAGSAMPLVWAHAEHIKLLRSLRDGRVFDMPPQTVERYLVQKQASHLACWRFNHKTREIAPGKTLRIEALAPFTLRWTSDAWRTTHDADGRDSGLEVWYADLPTGDLSHGATIEFTFYWPQADRWEGANFAVKVAHA